MSRQRLQVPQWSTSGASGSSSAAVRMAPRNSQEPNSRDTRLVCLPCQPSPAASRQRLLHQRRGVDEDLDVGAAGAGKAAGDALEAGAHDVVVVLALGVAGDGAAAGLRQDRQRVAGRRVVHAQHDDRARLRATWLTGCRRRSAVVAIHSMSPCRPSCRKSASRWPVLGSIAAGVVTRAASKPAARASASTSSLRFAVIGGLRKEGSWQRAIGSRETDCHCPLPIAYCPEGYRCTPATTSAEFSCREGRRLRQAGSARTATAAWVSCAEMVSPE